MQNKIQKKNNKIADMLREFVAFRTGTRATVQMLILNGCITLETLFCAIVPTLTSM